MNGTVTQFSGGVTGAEQPASLTLTANYLYSLCRGYNLRAQAIVNGGGGSVSPINPNQPNLFPIYITQADFTTATFYPNTNLFGNNLIVFLNEINRYLIPGIEFSIDAAGLNIINTPGGIYLDGFDALSNSYNLVIEKYYN